MIERFCLNCGDKLKMMRKHFCSSKCQLQHWKKNGKVAK